MTGVHASVVIAVEHSPRHLPLLLERVCTGTAEELEVLVCVSEMNHSVRDLGEAWPRVRWLMAPSGARVPHMWALGIWHAEGDLVALTTSHCIPRPDWITRILDLAPHPEVAGIGGVFEPPRGGGAADWAVYFLRYGEFTSTRRSGTVETIAADNAVYKREYILEHGELLETGFWEPEFHSRFHSLGLRLALDTSLRVRHQNCYSIKAFCAQRVDHGRAFGRARADRLTKLQTLGFIVISPGLPFLFLAKVVVRVLRLRGIRWRLAPAILPMALFIACWGFGELRGYVDRIRKRSADDQ